MTRLKDKADVRSEQQSANSLCRWMLEAPVHRLFKGLVLPLGVLFAFAGVLLYNPTKGGERPDGRVVVTYWEKWSGFEGEAIKDAVDCFNREQDRIYVDLTIYGDITQKVRIAGSGGNPPDLAGLYSFDVPVFAAQNALIPLDGALKEAGIGPETYVPAYWRLCVYGGKVWTVPTAPSTLALHWNKKLFREAGLDPDRPPRSIAELDEYAEKLTKRDRNGRIIQAGFLPTEPGWWKYSWGFWFGGDVWDGKGKLTANSAENLAAMKWVKSYADRYGHAELDRFKKTFGGFSSADNAFFVGKVAMEIQGVWMANFIKRYAPKDFEWGAAAFPSAVPGLEKVTIAEADVIGIPRGAKHPREALEFIKFMATPKGMEILCRGHAKDSTLTKTSPGWEKGHPNPSVALFSELARSPNCHRTPPIGIWREYNHAFGRAFDDVWTGKKTPEQALDALQDEMQRRFEHEVPSAGPPGAKKGEDK